MKKPLKFEFIFNKGDHTSDDGLNDFYMALGKFTKNIPGKTAWEGDRVAIKKFKITIETVK